MTDYEQLAKDACMVIEMLKRDFASVMVVVRERHLLALKCMEDGDFDGAEAIIHNDLIALDRADFIKPEVRQ